ncbi:MAG: hypothetical protein OXH68_04500 [Gammaproteobacteria bacterium]|nr:hypothetical protein [Gammaproteobacteria bacterium]
MARRVALSRRGADVDDAVQNAVVRVMESLVSLADAQAFEPVGRRCCAKRGPDACPRRNPMATNDRAAYVRLSLLPGGTLVAGLLAYEAGGERVRHMATNPVETLEVEVAEETADDFFHLRVLRQAILALDGPEVSFSVTRSRFGHGMIDLSDGKHRALTLCSRIADELAAN